MSVPTEGIAARSRRSGIPARVMVGQRGIRRYRDRQACADTDLHERAIADLLAHVPHGARVADVGAGMGAFSLRMADAGYDVVAIDIEPPSAHPPQAGYAYEQVDLLDPAARERYLDRHRDSCDAVVLLEVIEHVRNPWEALDFCRALLRPGGILLLSTPNITSFFSRFRFLTGGRFHQFEAADFSYGHINPMTALMVGRVLSDTGFELIDKHPGPPVPVLVWDTAIPSLAGRLLHAASYLVAAALTPLMRGGDRDGWSLFFVSRRIG